jgi:hypothetical protein
MPRKRRRVREQCVYCGQVAICTREHVIPRGFYPEDSPRPKDPVIVPACPPCNGRKARDDSYVRDLFAADFFASANPKALSVLNGQVSRSIRHNHSHFGRLAASNTVRVPVGTTSGLYLGDYPAVRVDWKYVRRFFKCVVRGVYWHVYQDRLPDNYLFDVERVGPHAANSQLQQFTSRNAHGPFSIGEGVFAGSFGVCKEDPFLTLWLFWFYDSIFIVVSTGPRSFFEQLGVVGKRAAPLSG